MPRTTFCHPPGYLPVLPFRQAWRPRRLHRQLPASRLLRMQRRLRARLLLPRSPAARVPRLREMPGPRRRLLLHPDDERVYRSQGSSPRPRALLPEGSTDRSARSQIPRPSSPVWASPGQRYEWQRRVAPAWRHRRPTANRGSGIDFFRSRRCILAVRHLSCRARRRWDSRTGWDVRARRIHTAGRGWRDPPPRAGRLL